MSTVEKHRSNILWFGILIMLISCLGNTVFHENISLKGGTWKAQDSLTYKALIRDTIHTHDIYLTVRNKGSYPFSNLYVFITTHAPSGSTRTDTAEFILADKRGKWLGKGFGDIWQNERPFKIRVRFPNTGIYVFIVRQGMRPDNLSGIMDFGIRIEKKAD